MERLGRGEQPLDPRVGNIESRLQTHLEDLKDRIVEIFGAAAPSGGSIQKAPLGTEKANEIARAFFLAVEGKAIKVSEQSLTDKDGKAVHSDLYDGKAQLGYRINHNDQKITLFFSNKDNINQYTSLTLDLDNEELLGSKDNEEYMGDLQRAYTDARAKKETLIGSGEDTASVDEDPLDPSTVDDLPEGDEGDVDELETEPSSPPDLDTIEEQFSGPSSPPPPPSPPPSPRLMSAEGQSPKDRPQSEREHSEQMHVLSQQHGMDQSDEARSRKSNAEEQREIAEQQRKANISHHEDVAENVEEQKQLQEDESAENRLHTHEAVDGPHVPIVMKGERDLSRAKQTATSAKARGNAMRKEMMDLNKKSKARKAARESSSSQPPPKPTRSASLRARKAEATTARKERQKVNRAELAANKKDAELNLDIKRSERDLKMAQAKVTKFENLVEIAERRLGRKKISYSHGIITKSALDVFKKNLADKKENLAEAKLELRLKKSK